MPNEIERFSFGECEKARARAAYSSARSGYRLWRLLRSEELMQIRTQCTMDGDTIVEVIDASDGAVTHSVTLDPDQQIVVTAVSAHSPADIVFGEVEAIPEPEAESAEAGGEEATQGTPVPGGTMSQGRPEAEGAEVERVEDDGEAEQGA